MKRMFFKKLIMLLWGCSCSISFACKQFPLTITLSGIPSEYLQLHKFLCKKTFHNNDSRNRFACAFVVKYGQLTKTIYIDKIEKPITMSTSEKFFLKTLKNEINCYGMCNNIQKVMGNFIRAVSDENIQNLEKSSFNLLEYVFENGAFVNAANIPLHCLKIENEKCAQMLSRSTQNTLAPMDKMQKLFFAQKTIIMHRTESDNALYREFNADSELHALYILQEIADDLAISLVGDEKITAIEFHGCTTRDMCPLCYTNMNCMQFIANQCAKNLLSPENIVGPLALLVDYLRKMNRLDSDCKITTFISSLQEFPAKEHGGNMLWELYSAGEWQYWVVNQFRIDADIQQLVIDANECELKREANITDLSALVDTSINQCGYRIKNTKSDGNCGFYAILQATNTQNNYEKVEENDANWLAAAALRVAMFQDGPLAAMATANMDEDTRLPLDSAEAREAIQVCAIT